MTPQFNDSDVATRAVNNVAAEIGDEVVILDIESGAYHQLNLSAAHIWALLDAPIAVADLCAGLEARFAVDSATCREAVGQFLQVMQSKGLVRIDAA